MARIPASSERMHTPHSSYSHPKSPSTELIADLKDNHDRLLLSLSKQLQDREVQLHEELDLLREENLQLREQLQAQELQYTAEIDQLKQDFSLREESLRSDAESAIKALEDRLESLTSTLMAEQTSRKELDAEIIEARRNDQAEIEAIHVRNREIQQEFELIKAKTIHAKDREFESLRAELAEAKSSLFSLQEELTARERTESSLIRELEKLQSTGNRELTSLKEVIQANKRALEVQNDDLMHLRKAKDDAKMEARRLQTILSETQHELDSLKSRYASLQQQYTRLDSLVRGRKATP